MAEPTQIADIVSLKDLTPHVREMVLLPREHQMTFRPGQWVSLKLPVGAHQPLNRAYSLADPEVTTGQLTLVLDHVPGGQGSGYLFSLKAGDRLSVSGPYGNFVVSEPPAKPLVFIGRYTGLVPLRCMVRAFEREGMTRSITLFATAPHDGERLYHQEFLALAERCGRFRYFPVAQGGSGPDKEATDLTATMELVKQVVGGERHVTPMICGIKAFARPLRAFFVELGFDRREVKIETYD